MKCVSRQHSVSRSGLPTRFDKGISEVKMGSSPRSKSRAINRGGRRASTLAEDRGPSKREKIIRSAAKLFLEKGYDNVSINDIIEAAGGSKETIYSNFGNKKNLFEAVVQHMCAEVAIRVDMRPEGTMEEQLTRIAHSFLSKVVSPQILAFHRLMTSIGKTFPAASRLFYKTGPQRVYRLLESWIATQQKSGKIRNDVDAMRLAILFHDMLVGDELLSRLTASSGKGRNAHIDKTVKLAVSAFLSAFATGHARN